MATYDVVSAQDPYLTVRVLFADQSFEQLLVTSATGPALYSLLQSYAETYEADWFAIQDALNAPPENPDY